MSIESQLPKKSTLESTNPPEGANENPLVIEQQIDDSAAVQTALHAEQKRRTGLGALRKRLGMAPLLHVKDIPMSATAEEVLKRRLEMRSATVAESIRAGRDEVYVNFDIEGMQIRPDHAYRAVTQETLAKYVRTGSVEGELEKPDVFVPGKNNAGVDWYLGGVAPKYGDFILETPARAEHFSIADKDSDSLMAKNIFVRHAKSEGGTKKSIPMSDVTVYELMKSEGGKLTARMLETDDFLK